MDMTEIARRAKVSIATVSRTINRVPTVDPHLARRVWRVVDELGYYPNTQARALVSGRTRIFGVIVSDMMNPFFPEIVQSFEDIAVEHGYEILLSSTVHDPNRMRSSVRRMIERRVDGVAILTFGMEELLLEGLTVRKVPLVFIDVGPPRPHIYNIKIDYQRGIRQAVQHLAALRHERIAFIAGPSRLPSAVTRRKAFEDSLREIGIGVYPDLILEGDHTMEGGMKAFDELSQTGRQPTAIMCSNDMTAIGVMREAYERGVSIPQKLSLIGFDDVRISQFMIPPLTTIQMSQVEISRLAFKALVAGSVRKTPSPKGTEFLLRTDLVLRKSTALAPNWRV